jgi:hypothetical protein
MPQKKQGITNTLALPIGSTLWSPKQTIYSDLNSLNIEISPNKVKKLPKVGSQMILPGPNKNKKGKKKKKW